MTLRANMETMDEDAIRQQAEHHYWTDAEFHAKVETVIQVVARSGLPHAHAHDLTDSDRSLARFTAAVALTMAERLGETMTHD